MGALGALDHGSVSVESSLRGRDGLVSRSKSTAGFPTALNFSQYMIILLQNSPNFFLSELC